MTNVPPAPVTPEQVAENYRKAVAGQSWRTTGLNRKDSLAPLTGGGVGVEASLKLARALALCHDVETEFDEELKVECDAAGEEYRQPTKFEGTYIGEWQKEDLIHMAANSFATLQGPRQVEGKTWTISVEATKYIGAGLPVILGMPTLTQGSRIIFLRAQQNLARLAVTFPDLTVGAGKDTNNQTEFVLSANGGRMLVRTMNKDADNEGYTCALFIGDEGHKYEIEVLNVFTPMTRKYMRQGIGKVLLAGIGGPPLSAIEAVQDLPPMPDHPGWRPLRRDGDVLAERYPESGWLRAEQAAARATLSAEGYRQHWRCQRMTGGVNPIFRNLPAWVEFTSPLIRPVLEFGHDVGESSDATVIIAVARAGETANILEHKTILSGKLEEQAREAVDYMRQTIKRYPQYLFIPDGVSVETNYGRDYFDEIRHHYPFGSAHGVFTSDKKPSYYKSNLIERLMHRDIQNNLGCADETFRRKVIDLRYNKKNNGEKEWPHSDELSALWVWEAGTVSPFAV